MTLQGFTHPLSPTGDAAFLAPPPWYFSGELLLVEFTTDAASKFLPRELTPDVDGRAGALFAEWHVRTQTIDLPPFREFALIVLAKFRTAAVARYVVAIVDDASSLARGWIQGMPKTLGTVNVSRPVACGLGGPSLHPGEVYRGGAAINGRSVCSLLMTLAEPVDKLPLTLSLPSVNTLVTPAWGLSAQSELVTSTVTDVELANCWTGRAELQTEPTWAFGELQPRQITGAFRLSYAETLQGGALAQSVDAVHYESRSLDEFSDRGRELP